MAYEFYTPGQAYQPDWAQAWSPQAFRQLYADTGFDPGSMSASDLRDGGDYNLRNKFYDYLAGKGMKLGLDSKGQYGKYQVFDQAGNAVGKGEDFNSGGLEILTPLLIAGGVAGLQSLGYLGGSGAGAGAAAEGAGAAAGGAAGAGETGIGTLGAGGSAAGGFTPSPLTGLGPGGGLTTGATSIPTLTELGYGAGSLDGLVGAGAGGLGGFASGVKDLAGNPLVKAGLTGLGAIGGAMGSGGQEASVQSQIDPRMAQYLYGTGYGDPNSLLGAAQSLWQQNKSGLNPLMQQGLDMASSALKDPAYSQSYTNMRDLGNSLMSGGVAGNPFTSGMVQLGGMPQMGQMPQIPKMQQEPRAYAGGTAGFDERAGFQNQPQPQQMNQAQEAAQLGGGGAQMTDAMRRIIGGARTQAGAGAEIGAMAAGDFDPRPGGGLLTQASPANSPGLLNVGLMRPTYAKGRGLL